ncbi:MAG: polysaccharide deacetylase family protein [Candidatus Aminicenantes bacterium]|nr:MAG: polysaccharide deacetylase family protein [Candidatus Aminicenantes bacterium]
MILINIPGHFSPERRYTIDILMGEMLGLDYRIELKPQQDYEIHLENGKKLIIRDHFFSSLPTRTSYLKAANIPRSVRLLKNRFVKAKDIPMIYGTEQLEITNNRIVCGIDVFASVFFMLSRWEEYVIPTRDTHQRFPATASLAFKHGFLDRPVVNEYVEMLWQMLCYLGCQQQRQEQSFTFVLTHDVDALLKWLGWYQVLHTFAGDTIKRKQIRTAFSRINEYRKIRRGKIKDPFDTYDWLMNLSESLNLKSHFYFMSGGLSKAPEDNHSPYPPGHARALAIFEKIKARAHIIGFHPGYTTYNNEELWEAQKKRLENACACSVTIGRQHYLRFQVPHTWQLWDNQNMEIDSTCGYSDREGFRCGTGHKYSVFNILTRKKLKLKEQPLIFMELRNFYCGGYKGQSLFEHNLSRIIDNAKTFNTPVTLLFHNDVFADKAFVQMYEEILQKGG